MLDTGSDSILRCSSLSDLDHISWQLPNFDAGYNEESSTNDERRGAHGVQQKVLIVGLLAAHLLRQ